MTKDNKNQTSDLTKNIHNSANLGPSKKNNHSPKFQKEIMDTMIKAGVHLGHQEAHPKMLPQIQGSRNKRKIINLKMTFKMLYQAKVIIDLVYKKGGTILFVCTRPLISQIIRPLVPKNSRIIFIGHKWVGGTLTNWEEILKYTLDMKTNNRLQDLKKSKFKRFINLFSPFLRVLNSKTHTSIPPKPSLVVLFHCSDQMIPVREAKKTRTPVISIVDTDSNPEDISYPIPGNDDNVRAQQLQARTLFHGIPSKN